MDIIFEYSYLLIIVAGVIASWLKSQKEAKEERRLEEIRRRKIAEQATEQFDSKEEFRAPAQKRPSSPPPLSRPTPPTSLQKSLPKPPALPDHSEEIARQQKIFDQVKELKRAKREKRHAPLAPAHSYNTSTKPVSTNSLRSRLKSRSEIRQAIVLKEILDKPIGLR